MRQIDVHQVIDNARFSRFHWMVMALCALLLIFDGYDLFIFGVVLPSIMQEWNLTPLEAGALGSYALFGMMFGALGFGTLADRIGRKKGIAICFVLFSGFTVLFGLLALIQLPRLNHPLFASKQFHRATDDGFFIAIEARDPKFNPEQTRNLLAEIGGDNIELVEEEDA